MAKVKVWNVAYVLGRALGHNWASLVTPGEAQELVTYRGEELERAWEDLVASRYDGIKGIDRPWFDYDSEGVRAWTHETGGGRWAFAIIRNAEKGVKAEIVLQRPWPLSFAARYVGPLGVPNSPLPLYFTQVGAPLDRHVVEARYMADNLLRQAQSWVRKGEADLALVALELGGVFQALAQAMEEAIKEARQGIYSGLLHTAQLLPGEERDRYLDELLQRKGAGEEEVEVEA